MASVSSWLVVATCFAARDRVRTVAAIPAVGLLAGAGAGLAVSEDLSPHAYALLMTGAAAALWAGAARSLLMAPAVAIAFAAGGGILAADAWQKAWRPTLRSAFERFAAAERVAAIAGRRVLPEDEEASATVVGVLRSDASPTAAGVSLSMRVEQIAGRGSLDEPEARSVQGGLIVTVAGSLAPARIEQWRAGRRLRMPVRLHRPARYFNPGVPDGERALARAGTALVGTVKSGALVEVIAYGGRWSETAAGIRSFARRAIVSAVARWNSRSAAIVTAIVIGDRAGMDDEVKRRLQEAGTYHVIAISGGNIAILAGVLLGVLRAAGCLGRGAMFAAISVLSGYAGVVGGGASVDRATLMAVVYFAARAFDQRTPPLNTLWTAAGVLLLADPLSVADPAFVLTFGATLGILLTQPTAPSVVSSPKRESRLACTWFACSVMLRRMLVASAAAEAMLLPIGALLFSRITFAGLALNFLAIPLMGVAQIAGMAVVPSALLSEGLAAAIGWIAHLGASGLVSSAGLVQYAPLLTYRVAAPAWSVLVIYYVSLGIAWWLAGHRCTRPDDGGPRRFARVRRAAIGVAVATALWILAPLSSLLAARGDGRLHATFIDVGQGDSTLLRFPGGTTMLVDAGGAAGFSGSGFDIGDRVVSPVLRNAGIRRLDFALLTHADPDHAGGMAAILREFRPLEVWEGIPVPRFEPLAGLRAQAEGLGSRWANVFRGARLLIEGVEVAVEHPPVPDWQRQRVRNDDSLVVDVRWNDVSLLLTGDIGREAERPLLEVIRPAVHRVLKVPHHGSLTSSSADFVRAVAPKAVVFSTGRANRFGHPAPAVLERYREIGAEIFRTDRDGAVMVETDGRSIEMRAFGGRRLLLPSPSANHEATKGTK